MAFRLFVRTIEVLYLTLQRMERVPKGDVGVIMSRARIVLARCNQLMSRNGGDETDLEWIAFLMPVGRARNDGPKRGHLGAIRLQLFGHISDDRFKSGRGIDLLEGNMNECVHVTRGSILRAKVGPDPRAVE